MRVLIAILMLAVASAAHAAPLRIAMVTSLESAGIAPVLIGAFEHDTGIETEVVYVGSGQAFVLARRGDVDVLLTHEADGEQALIRDGISRARVPIMQNRFVMMGPAGDPAGIAGAETIYDAYCAIAQTRSPFISRGDLSGTHRREQKLWAAIGVEPGGGWYRPVGSGMAASLRVASEFRAYAMADWASALKLGEALGLRLFSYPDPVLANIYAVSLLSADRFPGLNHADAQRFADWLSGPVWQKVILRFRIADKPVYRPARSQNDGSDPAQPALSDDAPPLRKNAPCRVSP
mgnify:CR=1 FL=1